MRRSYRAGCIGGLVLAIALTVFPWTAAAPAVATEMDFFSADLITKEAYRKISMDFKDASLKSILKIFSEQAGLNFIAASSIQDRTITLYLDQVPLQEALGKIMKANNLTYEMEPGGNVFIVKETGLPAVDVVTKIYTLRYTRLKSSRLDKVIKDSAESSTTGGEGGSSSSSSSSSESSGGEGEDKDAGIEGTLKSVLTANGKLVQDVRTNSLIITDVPQQFPVIEKVIALLDTPTPQVMIEVEMLDVSKKTIDEMGVDTTAELMELTGSSAGTRFPNFFADGKALTGPEFSYGTLSASAFKAVLDFLRTDTKTKYLARPRIITLSGESAEIKITTQEAIGQNTVTSSSQANSVETQQAERVETGVSMKVTPQVDPLGEMVTMYLEPTVSEAKTGATFGNTTYKDPETRTSKTTLMVKNGETIVVGGLILSKDEITIKKIPFFGDIPVIGAAFRHKDSTKAERELLVFITPRIVSYDNVMKLVNVQGSATPPVSLREQPIMSGRKEEVDNMLERWEN